MLWAYENGVTSGVDAAHFAPDRPVTRGQFVTLLWHYAGEPAHSGENPFRDVGSSYYFDAVLWAAQTGITTGTGGGRFSPDSVCQRGQTVTFLYRYFSQAGRSDFF